MNTIKSVISGVIFIFIASLLMQLAYLFIAVAYNHMAHDHPQLNEISWVFRYLVAIPVFLSIMFSGGYISAIIIRKHVLIHSLIVGISTTGFMMWMALQNAELTSKGVVINIFMLVACIAGALYWQKRDNNLSGLKT